MSQDSFEPLKRRFLRHISTGVSLDSYKPSAYWQFRYESLKGQYMGTGDPTSPEYILRRAEYFFQKGIVSFMAGQDREGTDLMYLVSDSMIAMGLNYLSASNWIQLFFARWLSGEEVDPMQIQNAMDDIEGEINCVLDRVRDRYCYDAIVRSGITVEERINLQRNDFPWEPGDHHTYESMGDLLLFIARLELCCRNFKKVVKISTQTQSLYSKAIDAAHRSVSLEDSRWSDTYRLSDVEINSSDRPDREEILKTRELFRGNIPLGRRQAEILKDMADYLYTNNYDKLKELREKLVVFFCREISHWDSASSKMSILDKLTWIYIWKLYYSRIFNKTERGSPRDILRKLLDISDD